jgi:serine protease Do
MNRTRTREIHTRNHFFIAPLAAAVFALGGCTPQPSAMQPPVVPSLATESLRSPEAPAPTVEALVPPRVQLTPAEIAARAMPAVVVIRSPQSLGTGFVVRKDGWIATNYHVIASAKELSITVPGRGDFLVRDVLVADPDHDLAIVRIDAEGLPTLPLGDFQAVRPGDALIAIGHPLGFEGTVSNGLVSAVRHINDSLTILQISAPIAPGSSGGPLIDAQGRVIGVATAMIRNGQNLNLGIPVTYLKEALNNTAPVPFAAFAQAIEAARPPAHPAPHHELSILAGCTDDELRLLRAHLELAIARAGSIFAQGNYVLTYHVIQGDSIEAERKLGLTCAGPRRTLAEARHDAERLSNPKAQAIGVRKAFDGVLDVIERKLGAAAQQEKSPSPASGRKVVLR